MHRRIFDGKVAQVSESECDGPEGHSLCAQVTQASISNTCDVACSRRQRLQQEEAASATPPLPRADDDCNNVQHHQHQNQQGCHKTGQQRYDEAGSCQAEKAQNSHESKSPCRSGPGDGPEAADPGLRRWDEMPRYLQFNPHILSGYRPLMTPAQCLRSIFCLHNETVNILSHGFAIVYILVTVPYLLPWGARSTLTEFLSWCHLIGAVSPWIGSFLYHVFMNLENGESIYSYLLKLDMLGIWICQSFGAMPLIAATVHCLPDTLWYLCIGTYCILSVWGLFKAMQADSPWQRRLCFSPPFMFRMLVVALRSQGIGGGNPEAFNHVVLQDLVAVVAGMIGAMRVPEKWLPGQLDMLFNSHNIMHVMVVVAVRSMHTATMQDLDWMSRAEVCDATPLVAPEPPIHQEL